MTLKPWMRALVWLGLGGGIGFFSGYRLGVIKTEKSAPSNEILESFKERIDRAEKRNDMIEHDYQVELERQKNQHQLEMDIMNAKCQKALEAQRQYLGAKDDTVISEGQVEMQLDDDSVFNVPDIPEPFEEESAEEEGEEEIEQLHPENIRPFSITSSEYLRNEDGYDQVQLDYYTEDCVIFDPEREEKWTHPEQLLGIGWRALFESSGKPIKEAYIQNDTMACQYKITRIDDSFERLYEEE